MDIDRWFKVCISIILAVMVWVVIMMTISTFHAMSDRTTQHTEVEDIE